MFAEETSFSAGQHCVQISVLHDIIGKKSWLEPY